MYNFNEDAIREAAYFIWKNNGCPSNSSLSDWDAAINQLSSQAALKLKAPKKISSSVKVLMPKKTTAKVSSFHNVKSIILKPASSLKTTAAKKTSLKSISLKASSLKTTAAKKTVAKKATKKSK